MLSQPKRFALGLVFSKGWQAGRWSGMQWYTLYPMIQRKKKKMNINITTWPRMLFNQRVHAKFTKYHM